MAGLLATEGRPGAEHFFKDVAIADVGAGKGDAFLSKNALQSEVGHGGGDDAIAGELTGHFKVTGGGEKRAVAVDDAARVGDEEGAIGIAEIGRAELGFFGEDALLKIFKMQGAAVGVDVTTVGSVSDRHDVGAQRSE